MLTFLMNLEYLIGTVIFVLIMVFIFTISRIIQKKSGDPTTSLGFPKMWAFLVCTLVFTVGIISMFNLSAGAKKNLIRTNDNYTRVFAMNITSILSADDKAAEYLSGSKELADKLRDPAAKTSVDNLIDQAKATFGLSVVYLLDANGLTIATTNRNEADSFLGKNYAFRPYFQSAINGKPKSIFALGVTSQRRGYYSACPVKDSDGRVLGVLAVKRDVENMNELFLSNFPLFLVSDTGEVFFSHDPKYYMRPFVPGTSAGKDGKKTVIGELSDSVCLFESGNYFYSEAKLHVEGWTVCRLVDAFPTVLNNYITLALLLLASTVFLAGATAFQIFKDKQARIEKRESEKALKESTLRFNEMADSLPHIVFEMDTKANLTYVNKHAKFLTGYGIEDFPNTPSILQFLHPDDLPRAIKHVQMAINNETFDDHEYKLRRSDGTYIPVLIHSTPIYVAGKIQGLRGLIIDISVQKIMEEEIRKNEKLEVIGSLAGGIAHDFNNILASIQNAFSLLDLEKNQSSAKSVLADMKPAIDRGRDLTNQLLSFSRDGLPVKKTVSLGAMIEQTAKFILTGSKVNFILSIAPDLKPVLADEGQLSQVIQNIVINARESMNGGGTISILAMNSQETDEISVIITDEGPGIPPDILPRIFDPFFTTKKEGNGLGLSICQTIIRNHQGTLKADANKPKGTRFIITLPVSETAPAQTASRSIVPTQGSGRILLMDDDPVLLKLGHALLSKLGFSVDTSLNGAEALEKYSLSISQNRKYKIVILDLTIAGGMGGKETLDNLIQMDPEVKAIVTSGYSTDPVMSNFKAHGFSAVVVKPYTAAQLSEAILAVEEDSKAGHK